MFKSRSNKKELLDAEQIPEQDLIRNLRELHTINSLLGGYAVSISALRRVISEKKGRMTLVDIGSGGGDTLKEIDKFARGKDLEIDLFGIDLKEVCVSYSRQNNVLHNSIKFVCDDYRNVLGHVKKIDILHASLFCHHLQEAQILELISFALENRITLVVNDLERNPVAYYAIKALTALFSRSHLVKNDAPLSVLRGFKKKEWLSMIAKTQATRYTVKNKWAFRHEIIIYA